VPLTARRSLADPFIDRDRQLATLREAWAHARDGQGCFVLVTGGVGTGRARLAEELSHVARDDGARVIYGAVTTDFLPLSAVPLLVVLDDLENAATTPMPTLRTIATEARWTRLLVLGRTQEQSRQARELEAAGAHRVQVEAFDSRAVASFAERLLGGALSSRVLEEIVARTRGNALYLRELLRLVDSEGWLRDEVQAVAALRTWRRLQDVVVRRLARLSGPCRRLLGLAASQGTHFDVGVLRRAAGEETEGFLDRLDEAERAALIGPSPWRPGQYRFAHPVIAVTARELAAARMNESFRPE
jgi:predicted ATPase